MSAKILHQYIFFVCFVLGVEKKWPQLMGIEVWRVLVVVQFVF